MPQSKIEKRVIEVHLEARDLRESGEGLKISGRAVPFDSSSQLLSEGGKIFFESINPQAFDESLRNTNEIMLLYSHDWNAPLARRSAGTLDLRKEADGIHFEATLTDTTRALDLVKDIKAGNIYGLSFGFVPLEDKWTRNANNELLKEVVRGVLLEISPVVNPAYVATTVESRSLVEFLKSENKADSDALSLAKFRFLNNKNNQKKGI